MNWLGRVACGFGLSCAIVIGVQGPAEIWTFDRTDSIGGHPTTILGHPHVIDTPAGKAVEFNGVDDALYVNVHPLTGAETFTWEAIFRPDGGAPEQRWFHLAEQDPKTGSDTGTRMLFEIRVIDGQWCLDAFSQSGKVGKALLNRERLHPLGHWYHVAAVYDGHEFRNYVNACRKAPPKCIWSRKAQGVRPSVSASIASTTSKAPSAWRASPRVHFHPPSF